MRIAVDAVGGDQAPRAPVAGIAAVLREGLVDALECVLLGPRQVVAAEVERQGLTGRVEIVDAPDIIGPDDSPTQAVRRKKDSSIVIGTDLVADRRVDAFLSAGNTGALMVAAKLRLGAIAGIDRPALATLLPTWDGRTFLMLDLGAQPECTPQNLLQFALMGSVYMEHVMGRPRPKVALLNIGSEAGKGGRLLQEAYRLLERSGLNFLGNVEGRNLLEGTADVVVCDGFVGNVVLKNMEGVALGLLRVIKDEIRKDPLATIGAWLARNALRRVRKRVDYSEYGGAPLLGITGVVIKCHGSSDANAVRNGILAAVKAVREEMVDRISQQLAAIGKAVE